MMFTVVITTSTPRWFSMSSYTTSLLFPCATATLTSHISSSPIASPHFSNSFFQLSINVAGTMIKIGLRLFELTPLLFASSSESTSRLPHLSYLVSSISTTSSSSSSPPSSARSSSSSSSLSFALFFKSSSSSSPESSCQMLFFVVLINTPPFTILLPLPSPPNPPLGIFAVKHAVANATTCTVFPKPISSANKPPRFRAYNPCKNRTPSLWYSCKRSANFIGTSNSLWSHLLTSRASFGTFCFIPSVQPSLGATFKINRPELFFPSTSKICRKSSSSFFFFSSSLSSSSSSSSSSSPFFSVSPKTFSNLSTSSSSSLSSSFVFKNSPLSNKLSIFSSRSFSFICSSKETVLVRVNCVPAMKLLLAW